MAIMGEGGPSFDFWLNRHRLLKAAEAAKEKAKAHPFESLALAMLVPFVIWAWY